MKLEKMEATPLGTSDFFVKIENQDFINRAHDSIQSYILTNTSLEIHTTANGKVFKRVPISSIIQSVRKNKNGIILTFLQQLSNPEQLAAIEFVGRIVGKLQGGSLNAEQIDIVIQSDAYGAFKELLQAARFEILQTQTHIADQTQKTITVKIDSTSDKAYYASQIQLILQAKTQAELGIMNQSVLQKADALRAYANEKIGDLDKVQCECFLHQCTGAQLREKGLTTQYFKKNGDEITETIEVYLNRDVVDGQWYVYMDNNKTNTVSLRETLALAERFGNQLHIGGGLKTMDWQIREILDSMSGEQNCEEVEAGSQKDE